MSVLPRRSRVSWLFVLIPRVDDDKNPPGDVCTMEQTPQMPRAGIVKVSTRSCGRAKVARRLGLPLSTVRRCAPPLAGLELHVPDLAKSLAHLFDDFHLFQRSVQRVRRGTDSIDDDLSRNIRRQACFLARRACRFGSAP